MPATERLAAALKNRGGLAQAIINLKVAQHLHNAADLAAARQMFHPFSTAAVALLEPLRKNARPPAIEIFECPMVDKVVPGAPKKAAGCRPPIPKSAIHTWVPRWPAAA